MPVIVKLTVIIPLDWLKARKRQLIVAVFGRSLPMTQLGCSSSWTSDFAVRSRRHVKSLQREDIADHLFSHQDERRWASPAENRKAGLTYGHLYAASTEEPQNVRRSIWRRARKSTWARCERGSCIPERHRRRRRRRRDILVIVLVVQQWTRSRWRSACRSIDRVIRLTKEKETRLTDKRDDSDPSALDERRWSSDRRRPSQSRCVADWRWPFSRAAGGTNRGRSIAHHSRTSN